MSRASTVILAISALALGALTQLTVGASARPAPRVGLVEPRTDAREALASLPLAFVPNAGQSDSRVLYEARGGGATFFFTRSEVVLSFTRGGRGHAVVLRFVDANRRVEVAGGLPLPGKVNYLLGKDPSRWRTGVSTFGEVVYRELWPGIDLAFRGLDGMLKYEFRLRPGAKAEAIRLAYAGVTRVSLRPDGALAVETPIGSLTDDRPTSYQYVEGERRSVASRFARVEAGGYGFELDTYDPRRALVIDPSLAYSTFLGGHLNRGGDGGEAIAVDEAGNAYVTGRTYSGDFPTTPGAFDRTCGGCAIGYGDAFVTKLSADGSTLVYSTFLGGSLLTLGWAIAVDRDGNAYVGGQTFGYGFPTTPGAFDTTKNGDPDLSDAFVTKLNADGSALVYSTFLGGSSDDSLEGIALDDAGRAYVTGVTHSADFPTTRGAIKRVCESIDSFVTKFDLAGSRLGYSTCLGGGGPYDEGYGIAVDAERSAYVTGRTNSPDFPTTKGAFDRCRSEDAFVTKLSSAGKLIYSTCLGGYMWEVGNGIAVDGGGNAYVAGGTTSPDFPTTPGAFDTTFNSVTPYHEDVFITKLNATGGALIYSTYLGGRGHETGTSLAIDSAGNAYVTGGEGSRDFPITPTTSYGFACHGLGDAFVAGLNASGSDLVFSVCLSGTDYESGRGVTVDPAGNVYAAGVTISSDFPTTPGAFDSSLDGQSDAFVVKIRR